MPIHPKQIVTRQSLSQIANSTSTSELDNLLKAIDQESQMPLRMRVTDEYQVTVDEMTVKTDLVDNRSNPGTNFRGYLDLTGDVFGAQLNNAAQFDYWIVKNSSNPTTIFATNAIELNDGDYLICNTPTAAFPPAPTDGLSFGKGTAGNDRSRSFGPISGDLPMLPGGDIITVPTASGGNLTSGTGSPEALTLTDLRYINVGISLSGAGQIVFSLGVENLVKANASIPDVPAGQFGIGYITLFRDDATWAPNEIRPLANEQITQYTSSSGGGGGLPPVATSTISGIVKSHAPDPLNGVLTSADPSITTLSTDDGIHTVIMTHNNNQTLTFPVGADNIGRKITVYKSTAGGQGKFLAATGETIDAYGHTGTAPSTVTSLESPGESVVWECVSASAPQWRIASGGAAIDSFNFSVPSGDFTAGTVHWKKVNSVVYMLMEGLVWGGAGVVRRSNGGTVPSVLLPAAGELGFATAFPSATYGFTVNSAGQFSVFTGGGTTLDFGINQAGSYHLRT